MKLRSGRRLWDPWVKSEIDEEMDLLRRLGRLLRAREELLPGASVSLKQPRPGPLGDEEAVWLLEEGWDEPLPLRRERLQRLAALERVVDADLADELAAARCLASSPQPPSDTLLHAALPSRYVAFVQPEDLLAIAAAPDGPARLGALLPVLPYAAPGPALARATLAAWPAGDEPAVFVAGQGLIAGAEVCGALFHSIGGLIYHAQEYLEQHGAGGDAVPPGPRAARRQRPAAQSSDLSLATAPRGARIASLRHDLSAIAGHPLVLSIRPSPLASSWTGAPPAPPTAPLAALVPQAFALDPDLGLCAAADSVPSARRAAEVCARTLEIAHRSARLGGYTGVGDGLTTTGWGSGIGDAGSGVGDWRPAGNPNSEFRNPPSPWSAGHPHMFRGEVALVTGSACGIGKACAASLLARGAAVVGLDIAPAVAGLFASECYLGLTCDLTDEAAVAAAFEAGVAAFGGLDMLVLNAGIFPSGCRIDSLVLADWQRVMRINLDANLTVMRAAYPLLKLAPRRGRVVVNGSRNVPAPGPGAAAYSASKAAVTQLARVAALEWARDGIRINMIHPHAVFDTGIWTEDVLKARAASYNLTVEQYKTNNLLRVELTSHDVGELVAEMLGPLFEKSTGAQVPVDGGSDRVV